MSTNFVAEFRPQGPRNSFHNFSEILLQPLRISEIEKVEAMKALREKHREYRDSCLGSHFLREQYIHRASSERDDTFGESKKF